MCCTSHVGDRNFFATIAHAAALGSIKSAKRARASDQWEKGRPPSQAKRASRYQDALLSRTIGTATLASKPVGSGCHPRRQDDKPNRPTAWLRDRGTRTSCSPFSCTRVPFGSRLRALGQQSGDFSFYKPGWCSPSQLRLFRCSQLPSDRVQDFQGVITAQASQAEAFAHSSGLRCVLTAASSPTCAVPVPFQCPTSALASSASPSPVPGSLLSS